ncbi:hypothetical protein [Streptomyces sp. NPDC005251]|uniref:hypothetical protein n=1 Tax=unclassified Streptomyces TaxID=2593676 RepID=UPI00339E3FC1
MTSTVSLPTFEGVELAVAVAVAVAVVVAVAVAVELVDTDGVGVGVSVAVLVAVGVGEKIALTAKEPVTVSVNVAPLLTPMRPKPPAASVSAATIFLRSEMAMGVEPF